VALFYRFCNDKTLTLRGPPWLDASTVFRARKRVEDDRLRATGLNRTVAAIARKARSMSTNTYWPGETVPESGVYSVIHTNNHAQPHDVIILGKGVFPRCNECGDRVYFTLTKAAQNIAANLHFQKDGA
jgi:hypothetical protein